MALDDFKRALRRDAKKCRDSTTDDPSAFGAAIARSAEAIIDLAARAAPVVSGYMAIGSELDPAELMDHLRQLGAHCALPVMVAKDSPLLFRAWKPGDPLIERAWSIREPGPQCSVVEPDVLLVPLLLIDRAGNRLGYGGGFYDRTLAALRAKRNIIAIGVAHDTQVVDAVPHAVYDEPLDYLLTPSGLSRVHPAGSR